MRIVQLKLNEEVHIARFSPLQQSVWKILRQRRAIVWVLLWSWINCQVRCSIALKL